MNEIPAAFSLSPDSVDNDLFVQITDAIEKQGYITQLFPLPELLLNNLFTHLLTQDKSDFRSAGIGRAAEHQLNPFVRTDEVIWLDHEQGPLAEDSPLGDYLDWMENLRLALNRRLYLGLFDYECHYARYDKGAFYKKHVDAFKAERNRVVSTVLYLNPGWQPGDGGELVLYQASESAAEQDKILEVVQPLFGRMVLFLSEDFPHEVLVSNKPRYSLTGWFRISGDTANPVLAI